MKPANRDPSGLISLGQGGYAEDHEFFGDLANI